MRRLLPAVVMAALAPAASAQRVYVGVASDPHTGARLYEEQHFVQPDGERLVLYRCADGTAFARKHVLAGGPATAPAFELDDRRFGYREGVERVGERVYAHVRRSSTAPRQRDEVKVTPRLVIDAGFDALVKREWPALQRGETVTLDFLVPSRRRTYAFGVTRVRALRIGGEAVSLLKLAPTGVLGWFAPAIEVAYRDRDQRLMRFQGITNVRENPDDSVSARIDFPLSRESALTPAQWQAARAAALSACAVTR